MLRRPDPSPDALRRRRYRARQRAAKGCYLVALGATEIDWLIRLRWLSESEIGDRRAVGDAVARMVAASARR